jgi:hypothetical protein
MPSPEKKYCHYRLVLLAKLFFMLEGESKTFYNKQKLKEFMTNRTSTARDI